MSPQNLEQKLRRDFPEALIRIQDLTGTEDHYEVTIESNRFEGLTRVKQHQLVMDSLAAELKSGEVHALALKTLVPKK